MLIKEPGGRPGKVRVTFEFPGAAWAETVHLVGDFNRWERHSLALSRSHVDQANWQTTLELDAGREYQFRYLVNGEQWYDECNADDYVANPFGGYNSLLRT